MDDNLKSTYSNVDKKVQGYRGRLRKAFGKQCALLQDIQPVLSYNQTSENPENISEIVEKLTSKILDERITKETFMK